MSFNVRWKRTAKDQLASIWITATDRGENPALVPSESWLSCR
jgi:hypothetical protein